MGKRPHKIMIGWRETVSLPELGLKPFQAKIDTGARTTALHARDIRTLVRNGKPMVEFIPDHGLISDAKPCLLPIHHVRMITNTSGIPDKRIIAVTRLKVGDRETMMELSLTDRLELKNPMIIGRTALRLLRLTVDPSRSWLVSHKPK